MTPDPEFLYWTAQHREALAGLTYAVLGRKGFMLLTGDAGTGKTTLLTQVLHRLPLSRIQTSVIVNPTLTPAEFLEAALIDFGFDEVPASKAQRIARLQALLLKGQREGKVSALIIDEAHKLTPEVLEEIRLLGNFENADEKLLQIVLIGQCELDELLSRESLRQFKQRIALRLTVGPLSAAEVGNYMRHRWAKAGGKALPFTAEAIACTAEAARGIPRVINAISDNALMQAFAEGSAMVETHHILASCVDLRLPAGCPEPPAPVPISVPASGEAYSVRTLERYGTKPDAHSLVSRLAVRLGLSHRSETA
jgi:general secretion pathway protein A